MKSEWQTKKLGALCEIELGKTPARADKTYWDDKRRTTNVWLSIADLLNAENNLVIDSKEYLSDKGAEISKVVRKGTLLASFKLTLGRLAFAGRDVFTNEAIAALTILNERELSKKFLFHFLHFFDWRKSAQNDVKLKGMTLNKAKLKEICVHFPSLTEQERIVGFLDEAFAGIASAMGNAERNLQNARAIFESQLHATFSQPGEGWEQRRLGDVCAITSTLVDPRDADFLDLIHVGAGNIESRSGELAALKTAREEGLISGKYRFDDSMVLYSKIRPYLVKVARPDFDGVCSADIYPLAPLPQRITRDFLFYLLLSNSFTEYAMQGSARAGMPKVNREHLFEFRTWMPDVKNQAELASKLDNLHQETQRLESIYQKKLAALETLKNSLLHQAFSGHL